MKKYKTNPNINFSIYVSILYYFTYYILVLSIYTIYSFYFEIDIFEQLSFHPVISNVLKVIQIYS